MNNRQCEMEMEQYVPASEVCRLLNVSLPTVYSYVSRGKLRSRAQPGSKRRDYWMPDVERLMEGRTSPVGWSAPGRVSALTLVTEEGPFYRGRSALLLSKTATLEEVAALLWDVPVERCFETPRITLPAPHQALASLLEGVPGIDRATALFPLLERADSRAFDLGAVGMARTGGDVLRWLLAILLGQAAARDAPLHRTVADVLGLDDGRADLVRRMLVLAADNGFEPGTVAVRAVASTGVTPWRAVLAGLSVTTGRQSRMRHHGAVARFVQSVITTADPARDVVQRLSDGEDLPGFSSAAYPHGDPRAACLLDCCGRLYADDPEYRRLRKALDVVEEILGRRPGLAMANIFARRKLGLDDDDTIFVVGRACGWIAHAIEQHAAGELPRDLVSYQGPLPE